MKDDPAIPDSLLKRIGIDSGRHLFVPRHFDFAGESGLLELIHQHPLAQLVSVAGEEIRVTAAALILDIPAPAPANKEKEDRSLRFIGHMARRNPHAGLVRQGAAAVAIFLGPNAYISPRWNTETPSLPTWSYVSVQARGVFEPVEDLDQTRDVLERTLAHLERDAAEPWRLEHAPPDLVAALIGHIAAFRFHVHDLQGIRRLNQNRKHPDRLGIIQGLRESGDAGALQIADLMEAECDPT